MWPTCDQPWSHGWMEGAGGHSTPWLRPHRNVETSLNHTESCWWFEVGPKGFEKSMGRWEKRCFFFCVLQKSSFSPLLGEKNHMDFLLCFQWSMNNSKVWRQNIWKKQPWWFGEIPGASFRPFTESATFFLGARGPIFQKCLTPLKPNWWIFKGHVFHHGSFFHP